MLKCLGIKTNKDLFFAVVCILWLTGNIIEYAFRGECFNNNILFIALMSTVVLEKTRNNAFYSWLNKKIYDLTIWYQTRKLRRYFFHPYRFRTYTCQDIRRE